MRTTSTPVKAQPPVPVPVHLPVPVAVPSSNEPVLESAAQISAGIDAAMHLMQFIRGGPVPPAPPPAAMSHSASMPNLAAAVHTTLSAEQLFGAPMTTGAAAAATAQMAPVAGAPSSVLSAAQLFATASVPETKPSTTLSVEQLFAAAPPPVAAVAPAVTVSPVVSTPQGQSKQRTAAEMLSRKFEKELLALYAVYEGGEYAGNLLFSENPRRHSRVAIWR